ncbi:MAG: DUF2671 domain-containing protein [Rickettsiales bacterium]|nr:DUF2671 domain-containing protein [Rickettsiales bacterium]
MKKINIQNIKTVGQSVTKSFESESEVTNMMLDPRYLRQSSALIQEALQKGFDVLQLANGDIVTTGTKTVVYQYAWDSDKGKLVKAKPDQSRKQRRAASDELMEIDSEEA